MDIYQLGYINNSMLKEVLQTPLVLYQPEHMVCNLMITNFFCFIH